MKFITVLLAMLISGSTFAAQPYAMQNLMLLQPDSVLRQRVQVDDLSNYIKSVNAAAQASLSEVAKPTPTAGFIVVAVRPGGRSKVWLDFSPALPAPVASRLAASLERVPPFQAEGGVVVFAINTALWGAAPTTRPGPSPQEWKDAMRGADRPLEIGDLVDLAWPAKPGN